MSCLTLFMEFPVTAFPLLLRIRPGAVYRLLLVNVAWAWLNLIVGYVLFRAGKVSPENYASLIVLLAGIVAISTILSFRFRQKMTQ